MDHSCYWASSTTAVRCAGFLCDNAVVARGQQHTDSSYLSWYLMKIGLRVDPIWGNIATSSAD